MTTSINPKFIRMLETTDQESGEDGKTIAALRHAIILDSGAQISAMPKAMIEKHGYDILPSEVKKRTQSHRRLGSESLRKSRRDVESRHRCGASRSRSCSS